MRKKFYSGYPSAENTVLSGLATTGKILLPVMKTRKQLARKEANYEKRLNLMQQGKGRRQNSSGKSDAE